MEEKFSRKQFVRVGAALGVSAASASVLAACGGSSSGSGSDGSDGGGNGSGGGTSAAKPSGGKKKQASGGDAIAKESEVASGSAVSFKDSGQPAVLVHLDSGDFVAYSAICTHQGCTVAYKDGKLACPCHGSVYDPAKGAAVVTGPAPSPLPKIPVKVKGGEVVKA